MGRGRPKNLDTIARDMLIGSCVQKAVVTRHTATTHEAVLIEKRPASVKVTTLYKNRVEPDAEPARELVMPTYRETENDMPYQGMIEVSGMLIPFYGSNAAYLRLLTQ